MNGPENSKHLVDSMKLQSTDVLLDAGCGTGSFSIAAHASVHQFYALDIALRWLIICRKRFEENGLAAHFVCADICNLPFPDESFDAIAAVDVVEHTNDPMAAIDAAIKVLAPSGRICTTGTNRYVLGPHPSGRIWFAGYMPRALRSWIAKLLRGYDSLRHTRLVSPFAVRARLERSQMADIRLWPRRIGVNAGRGYSASAQWLVRVYRWISGKASLRPLVVAVGPSFEVIATKPTFAVDAKESTE
jgi:ubiquinone/menaquinone biosynthesis C-methylase UbiE